MKALRTGTRVGLFQRGVSEIRGSTLGVPMIRIMVLGVYNYQMNSDICSGPRDQQLLKTGGLRQAC